MKLGSVVFIIVNLCVIRANSHKAQKADDSNPFLDLATSFLQETLSNQQGSGRGSGDNGAGASIAGIAQIVGSLMQQDSTKPNVSEKNVFPSF